MNDIFAIVSDQLDPPPRLRDLTDAELDEVERMVEAAEGRSTPPAEREGSRLRQKAQPATGAGVPDIESGVPSTTRSSKPNAGPVANGWQ